MAATGVLRTQEGGTVAFWCPGCERAHSIRTQGAGAWGFDGSFAVPTFSPSILVSYPGSDAGQMRESGHRAPPARCHSFVEAGMIRFLPDSTHALAGQTVALQPFPDA